MGDGGANRQLNVLGQPLDSCCKKPMTGFYRDGYCNTGPMDVGTHTVCAAVTQRFLEFSAWSGNDLITPRPDLDFPGLVEGDRWCLCAMRWVEAMKAGYAPKLYLKRTNIKTLDLVSLDVLKEYALDLT